MRIALEIILVIIAVTILIFNFMAGRQTANVVSVVAVCGTLTLLVRSLRDLKRR